MIVKKYVYRKERMDVGEEDSIASAERAFFLFVSCSRACSNAFIVARVAGVHVMYRSVGMMCHRSKLAPISQHRA